MNKETTRIIYALLGLAALCVIAVTVLDVLDKTDAEVLTILGTALATIIGAVAGVVVGGRVSTPTPEASVSVVEAPDPFLTATGPDAQFEGASEPQAASEAVFPQPGERLDGDAVFARLEAKP